MKEIQNKTSKYSRTQRLKRLFILTIVLLSMVLISLVFFIHRSSKNELAEALADSSRESLLIGDNRAAMIILGKSIPKWFNSVQVYKENQEKLFEINDSKDLEIHLSVPVWLIKNQTKYGSIKFGYKISGVFPYAFLWLGILLAILALLFRKEILRLKSEDMIREKVLILEIENKIARKVSHDIRSPLSAIALLSNSADLNSPETRNILKIAAKRISEVAQDLIDKTKMQNEIILLNSINVTELLTDIVNEKRFEYGSDKEINIVLKKIADGSIFISSNRVELSRIISNIINNSVEARRNNSINILVTLLKKDNSVIIKIEDNGIGIPKDVLKSLGKIRVSSGLKNSNLGEGLLYASEFMKQSNGEIEIESTENEGTTIWLKYSIL